MVTLTTTTDKRQATLKRLHAVVATTRHSYSLADAVMRMAIRYGAASVFDPADWSVDWRLARRAEGRRFEALQRLVTALERQPGRTYMEPLKRQS